MADPKDAAAPDNAMTLLVKSMARAAARELSDAEQLRRRKPKAKEGAETSPTPSS